MWFDVSGKEGTAPASIAKSHATRKMKQNPPVRNPMRVTPLNGTDGLRHPPREIGLWNRCAFAKGFDDVPERTAVVIRHDEHQLVRCLESGQEVWYPFRLKLTCEQKNVALDLWVALLGGV